MSKILRKLGLQDKYDPANFKRFNNHPKSDTSHILYRGDTRDPALIKQGGGFFPQPQRASVSNDGVNAGASTGMVSLTLDPSIGATYYSLVKKYSTPVWGASNKNSKQGFVYAVFVPTGRAIVNYKLAEQHKSKNAGSRELSALAIPWKHVIGWRQLPTPDACKITNGNHHLVDYVGAFTHNPDFEGNLAGLSAEAKEFFGSLTGMTDIVIYNSASL